MTASVLDKKVLSILSMIEENTAGLAEMMNAFDPRRAPGSRLPAQTAPVYAAGRVSAKKARTGASAMAPRPRTSIPTRTATLKQPTPLPLESAPEPPQPAERPIVLKRETTRREPAVRKARPQLEKILTQGGNLPVRPMPARDAKGRFVKKATASKGAQAKHGKPTAPRSTTAEKVVEARAKNQDESKDRRLGKMITGAIRSGFGAANSVMGGGSGQNGEKSDIIGTAAGGPMWSAVREMIDAVDMTKDNRFANAILARLGKKKDAVPEAEEGDGRRDEHGRFTAKTVGPAGIGNPDHIEIAEQNLEGVKDIESAIEDSDSNADRRNRQLIKAVTASGTGSGGATGDGVLDWLFPDKKKGPKKGPGRVKKALSSGLGFMKKAGGKAIGGIGSLLGFGKNSAGAAAKAGGGVLKSVLGFGKGAGSLLGLGGAGAAASGTTAATGGGLMATIGSILAPAAGVLGAGAGGYGVGKLINSGIGKMTGGGEGWLGNWLYDKLHPKAEAPVRYAVPKAEKVAEKRSAKEIRPTKTEAPKPQVIIQQVPAPAVKEIKHPATVRREKERAAGGYHIPTQFDDTLLMLMALDKI
ncbi:hypothetical protein DSCA_30290 [Desulfosarcina alkanivorans]|uniref:Uncharacterized protein n=1 Tax=Desulfosarcina alkanivorans TaxID=571177 RepID=A0A5K7YMK7_9BACT|nr:hypothetical protein [Desulfosarcina alkanivorans]BBO69099.1 hypothetical protein DSCA_30290 [Desulfosarcina alkanivorans]